MNPIIVKEFSAFCMGGENGGHRGSYRTLTPTTFNQLMEFALENNKEEEDDALKCLGVSARRGVGKIITVKNYVGVIALKDGTVIEILPKVYSEKAETGSEDAKRLLVRMLNTLYNVSYKNLQSANLDVCHMNLLEVFVRMFVDEVLQLTKQGLKSSYKTLEDNLTCFRGKIQFSKHIRLNFAHKERVYVSYDAFSVNRPENRLLKSTLSYLYTHSHSSKNKKDIKNLLNVFDEVEPSTNYDADFAKIVPDRNTKAYTAALNWARVFLKGKSFTSFSGSTASLALLFPMEKLFECYIATLLRNQLLPHKCSVSAQDKGYYLFDEPKRFALRPDIVIKTQDGSVFIMDTKWKLLNGNAKKHYGISQSDMYQMYAYYQKYTHNQNRVHSVTLIYPKTEAAVTETNYISLDGVRVNIKFVDMYNVQPSIQAIAKSVLSPSSV